MKNLSTTLKLGLVALVLAFAAGCGTAAVEAPKAPAVVVHDELDALPPGTQLVKVTEGKHVPLGYETTPTNLMKRMNTAGRAGRIAIQRDNEAFTAAMKPFVIGE